MNKVLLLILDGWGATDEVKGNAIKAANTPVFDNLIQENPNTLLHASGIQVGLPDGIMGNSEVGHENIGAGRINKQKLTLISDMAKTGEFFQNQVLLNAVKHTKANNSKIHFMGLMSEGDVHSHVGHVEALIKLAADNGIAEENTYLHAITDGRDDPPNVASALISRFESKINIATVTGRYWAMDRDKNYDRVQKFFDAVIDGKTKFSAESAATAITNFYDYAAKNSENVIGNTDEFVEPTMINRDGLIKENDAVIFFNFRPDRAIEISELFKRHQEQNPNLYYACLTEYDSDLELPVAFGDDTLPKQDFSNTLGEYIASLGVNQFRVAETEKFRHVTLFFNGRKKQPFINEDRLLVSSPKVSTYDEKPEMSLIEVNDALIEALANKDKDYKLVVANFANPDMVGHTGNWDATIQALEEVDRQLAKTIEAATVNGYSVLVTADHGNADQMSELNDTVRTAHSCNLVPLIAVNIKGQLLANDTNCLANIAPTILDVMGLDKPEQMTAESLLVK